MTNLNFHTPNEKRIKNLLHNGLFAMVLMAAITITGCSADQPTNSVSDSLITGDTEFFMNAVNLNNEDEAELLKVVRQATARFHSTRQAERAGYAESPHCVMNVEGTEGMGYHWVNEGLVDPVFDPTQPEALLYEPDKNGNLKLIGVEYIVINVDQQHPHFGSHAFDVGGTPIPADHWSLHVWLYKENPSGFFAPFNPNVTCPEEENSDH